MDPLTVRQLIDELNKLDPDLYVWVDGGGYIGAANVVREDRWSSNGEPMVLITGA